jgi:hypothetical protein
VYDPERAYEGKSTLLVARVPKLGAATPNVVATPTRWDDYKTRKQPNQVLPGPIGWQSADAPEIAKAKSKVRELAAQQVRTDIDAAVARLEVFVGGDDGSGKGEPTSPGDAPPSTVALTAFSVFPGANGKVSATHRGFTCNATYAISADDRLNPPGTEDKYALLSLFGVWFGGVLPTRSCFLYRCPRVATNSTSAGDGDGYDCAVTKTLSRDLYRDPSVPGHGDNGGGDNGKSYDATVNFDAFSLTGSFAAGDLVVPMVGTRNGDVVHRTDNEFSPGESTWGLLGPKLNAPNFRRPLLSAMLYSHIDKP